MNKVIFLLLFLVPLISLGQESKYLKPDYDQEIDFGIRVGYGVTNYSEFKRSDLPDGYDLRNYGYGGGIFMQLRVNHIYFHPSPLVYFAHSYHLEAQLGHLISSFANTSPSTQLHQRFLTTSKRYGSQRFDDGSFPEFVLLLLQ